MAKRSGKGYGSCPYNDGVVCSDHRCSKCGFKVEGKEVEPIKEDCRTMEELFPKLYGKCIKCGEVSLKRDMTSICLKPPAKGGKKNRSKTVGHICEKCLSGGAE